MDVNARNSNDDKDLDEAKRSSKHLMKKPQKTVRFLLDFEDQSDTEDNNLIPDKSQINSDDGGN